MVTGVTIKVAREARLLTSRGRDPCPCPCARSAPEAAKPLRKARSEQRERGKTIRKQARRPQNLEKFPEGALRARRFAPSPSGSATNAPHISCWLGCVLHVYIMLFCCALCIENSIHDMHTHMPRPWHGSAGCQVVCSRSRARIERRPVNGRKTNQYPQLPKHTSTRGGSDPPLTPLSLSACQAVVEKGRRCFFVPCCDCHAPRTTTTERFFASLFFIEL
jgi:hypothetical protein